MLAILSTLLRRQAPQKEDSSFEALFRQHYARVLGFFGRRGCPHDERRDLAQETFLRALDGYSRFRGDAKASTWLLTIATNLWLNRLRAHATAKRTGQVVPLLDDDSNLIEADDRVETAVLTRERQRILHQAIDELPPQMRRCVLLRVYQDKSYREIARIAGVSESTAKSQVSRARQRLREALSGRFPELDTDRDDRKG